MVSIGPTGEADDARRRPGSRSALDPRAESVGALSVRAGARQAVRGDRRRRRPVLAARRAGVFRVGAAAGRCRPDPARTGESACVD